MARTDPHSYADSRQVELSELTWSARIDFEARRIHAQVSLRFGPRPDAPRHVDLDTRGLAIEEVRLEGGGPLAHELAEEQAILGRRLRVELPEHALAQGGAITIRYQTAPEASALQWLSPAQTAGGKLPFLFTQC